MAEKCEVSTRTIQRIESGEVDPRAYTLHCLSQALEFEFDTQNMPNENLWLTILHLSSMVGLLVVPLVLWSWKRGQSYKIDQQGRKVLNFQITILLLLFGMLLFLVLALFIPLIMTRLGASSTEGGSIFMVLNAVVLVVNALIGIFCWVQGVLNALRAIADKPVHYPLSIPFLK